MFIIETIKNMLFCLIFSGNDIPVDLDLLEADDQMLVSYSQSIEKNINTKTQTPTFNFNNCVVHINMAK